MPIRDYRCGKCGQTLERLDITTEDNATPPACCGEPMARQCGSVSICDVTLRGTWVRFRSNRPPNPNDKRPRGI